MAKKKGRPTKFTAKIAVRLRKYISVGATVADACAMVSISRDTFYRWAGSPPDFEDGVHSDFSDTIKKAYASRKIRWLMAVEKGGHNWQSKAWLLERIYKKQYGARIEHSGRVEHPVKAPIGDVRKFAKDLLALTDGDSKDTQGGKTPKTDISRPQRKSRKSRRRTS